MSILNFCHKKTISGQHFREVRINKIRTVIQKEKKIARGEIGYDRFTKKWSNFISIYDFRGPDPLPFL